MALKKAQVTLFVILGIFMVITAVAGFYAFSSAKKSEAQQEAEKISELNLKAEEIEKFANDCIRKTAFEAIKKLGQTGGYLEVPSLISFKGTSYWHLDQANIQPFLNQTQERLIEHMNKNVPSCIDDAEIRQLGFDVEKDNLTTAIEFGVADVTIKAYYPIKLKQADYTKEFSEFFSTFDIRYRAIFEAATETNEKTFEADFDEKSPLRRLDYLKSLDFDVSYKAPETDVLYFTITDRKSTTPENQNYAFNFAAKLGRSELKRLTDLQNRSATNPAFLPYTIFSVDKKAQLDISTGTTASKSGQDVKFISVQQSYPQNVVTKNVPVEKENKEIKRREDIVYVTDNPIYSFEPDGLVFNNPQKLSIYYDDPEGKDAKGVGILQGKSGFWVPIPSFEDRINRKVFANIIGFTDFTAIFCESQRLKNSIARQVFEANTGCYVQIAVLVAAIVLSIFTFGAGGFIAGLIEFAQIGTTMTIGAMAVLALNVLSIGLSIVGTATEAFYTETADNCVGFIPTCTWQVGVDTVKIDGEGKCIPEGGTMQAGVPVTLCAQVEKCNFIEKFTCQSCSIECTAQFY